jgi:hypothetical protein
LKIPQKIKRTKTGTTMKFGNNKNRQHRKNIIGDTECQETEMRKGKWHKRKCWTIILGSAFLWPLTTFFIVFFNQHRDVTFTNLALGLLAINIVFCLCYYIGLRAIWNLYPKISLNNKETLKNVTLPYHWKDLLGDRFKFDRIDNKQIVINNDGIAVRVFFLLIFLVPFLALLYWGVITPSEITSESYVNALLFLEPLFFIIVIGLKAFLQPWRRIVFDRDSKTITIPGRFMFQKKETLPYEQVVITLFSNHHAKTFNGKGEEEIVIANPQRTLGRIPLGIAGGINAARQFARFIQLYMEEEEVQSIPEFEEYSHIIES